MTLAHSVVGQHPVGSFEPETSTILNQGTALEGLPMADWLFVLVPIAVTTYFLANRDFQVARRQEDVIDLPAQDREPI